MSTSIRCTLYSVDMLMCEGYNEGPFPRPAVLRRCVPDDSRGECDDGYGNRAAGHLEQTHASRWHPYRLLQPIFFHATSTFMPYTFHCICTVLSIRVLKS